VTWEVDQPCEVLVAGRWSGAIVIALESGRPRARVLGTGKLVRCPTDRNIRAVGSRAALRGVAAPDAPAPLTVPSPRLASAAAQLVAQPKPRTPRDPRFLDWLRSRACDHCGAPPRSEAAHFGPDRGVGLKASDYEACSLCTTCHGYWHNHGTLPGLDREQSMLVQWRGAFWALITFPPVPPPFEELSKLAAENAIARRRSA